MCIIRIGVTALCNHQLYPTQETVMDGGHEQSTSKINSDNKWHVVDGVVHTTITTTGIDPNNYQVGDNLFDGALQILRSPLYHASTGVTSNVVIVDTIAFDHLHLHDTIRTQAIMKEMLEKGYKLPSPELALEIFSKWTLADFKAMNMFSAMIMHTPIEKRWLAVFTNHYSTQLCGYNGVCGVLGKRRHKLPMHGLLFEKC